MAIFTKLFDHELGRFIWTRRGDRDHIAGGKFYRKMPVKGIRCYRGGGSIFRYPKTIQELRELDYVQRDQDVRDLKIKIRLCRNNTPTAWDDLFRSDVDLRSWKKYRRHQWK